MGKRRQTLDGLSGGVINVNEWLPDGEVIGGLHILHGMAEHSMRYEEFAKYMNGLGYVVWAHDHRQHGESVSHDHVGVYSEVDTWATMVGDIDLVQKTFSGQYPEIKIHMLGHSMGSALLRAYVQTYPSKVRSLVVMGTPSSKRVLFHAGEAMAAVVNKISGRKPSPLMNQLSVGGFNRSIKNPRTSFDWISKDRAIVDIYGSDPLCGYSYTPLFYKELSKGMLMINRDDQMRKLPSIPMLMISGSDDPAGGCGKGVRKVSDHYKSLGKKHDLVLMDGMRHEVLNEVNRIKTYEVVASFIENSN